MLECANFHPDCAAASTPSLLPRRLINVNTLRIYHSQAGETGQYAALSYCWGYPMVRGALVRENLQSLTEDGISMDSLPPTVKDAVAITKRLELYYLWIDAYCIIQDSVDDKNAELAHMAAIYGGAYITLAAASAATVEDGFLQRRKHPKPEDWCSWVTLPDGSRQQRIFPPLSVQYTDLGTVLLACPSVHRDILPVDEPIDTRAWTYQEKTLSPRILLFRTETLQWLCNKVDTTIYGDEVYGESRPLFLAQPKDEGGRCFTPGELWLGVCQQYSSRRLTCAQDKLVALAAVATRFQQTVAHDRKYLAGLWSGPPALLFGPDLLLQLSWYVPWKSSCREVCLMPRPPGYIAPSWTWASVGSQVFFREPEYDQSFDDGTANFLLKITNCHATPRVSALPLCGVSDGQLCTRSYLYEAKVESTRSADGELQSFVSLRPSVGVGDQVPSFDAALWWIFWDVEDDRPSSVFCLRITTDYGLALARNRDSSNTFRRVGFLSDGGPYCFVRNGKSLGVGLGVRDAEQIWIHLSDEVFTSQELQDIVIV